MKKVITLVAVGLLMFAGSAFAVHGGGQGHGGAPGGPGNSGNAPGHGNHGGGEGPGPSPSASPSAGVSAGISGPGHNFDGYRAGGIARDGYGRAIYVVR